MQTHAQMQTHAHTQILSLFNLAILKYTQEMYIFKYSKCVTIEKIMLKKKILCSHRLERIRFKFLKM